MMINEKRKKKKILPSQHLIFNVHDDLTTSREMRVRRRRLFQLGKSSRTALLIQHLLLLKALHLEPRFVPLIIDAGENEDVQDQQAAANRDRDAQSCRVRRVSARKCR